MTSAGSVTGGAPWRLAARPRMAASERARIDGEQFDELGHVVPRVETYVCASAHVTVLRFARTAVSPVTWECPKCSTPAVLEGADPADAENVTERRPKEHLQQLHERRTLDELETLLGEHLAALRAGELVPVGQYLGRSPHIYGP